MVGSPTTTTGSAIIGLVPPDGGMSLEGVRVVADVRLMCVAEIWVG